MSSCILSSISGFDEHQWVIQIRKTLDEDLDDEEIEIPISIYSVPKTLMAYDQDSYTPHQVPIGPYHYWRQDLYEMQRYKLSSTKRMQRQHLERLKFEDVVIPLMIRFESKIRAYYHKYITCDSETLAWMMAMDACFMLEFLQIYAPKNDDQILHRVSSRMSHLVDVTGRKLAHNAILRDMVMLENQIPLFVVRKILEIKFSSLDKADNLLFDMLMGFFEAISPFKMMEHLSRDQVMECAHLLDVLYHLVVPKFLEKCLVIPKKAESGLEGEERNWQSSTQAGGILERALKILSQFNNPLRVIKKFLSNSKIALFLMRLPWKMLESMCLSEDKEKEKDEDEDSNNIDDHKPPLMEEIAIPSVSDLSKAYVNFVPTKGGILSINFDEKTRTFHLPSITLDENSCIIIKNLVAYEACNASGPLVLTRYTELMNGIIDTEEDSRILRENGIILNHLKSDEEVAKLWNGMNRSIRLTKVPHLDKVIGDVNKFYNARWNVKLGKLLKAYVYGSWQFLAFLACVVLLLLMTFQAFCSVYNCGHKFGLLENQD